MDEKGEEELGGTLALSATPDSASVAPTIGDTDQGGGSRAAAAAAASIGDGACTEGRRPTLPVAAATMGVAVVVGEAAAVGQAEGEGSPAAATAAAAIGDGASPAVSRAASTFILATPSGSDGSLAAVVAAAAVGDTAVGDDADKSGQREADKPRTRRKRAPTSAKKQQRSQLR